MANQAWCKAYFCFNIYQATNGPDANPDNKNKTFIPGTTMTESDLAKWICTQNRRQSDLDPTQITALDHCLFPWVCRGEVRWAHNMEQLIEFREDHGHCNVPQSNEKLGK